MQIFLSAQQLQWTLIGFLRAMQCLLLLKLL